MTQATQTVDYASVFEHNNEAVPGCTLESFEPHKDFVVCRRCNSDEMTKGGIVIPPNAQVDKLFAVVLKLPPDSEHHPMKLEPGDIVNFVNHGQADIVLPDGEKILLLRFGGKPDDEIMGRWPNQAKDIDGQ